MNDKTFSSAKLETGTRVLELAPDDVFPAPGNRPTTPDSVADLLPSISKIGQQVPGIVYPHTELVGKWMCAAGNRRLLCCRIVGRKFKAVPAEGPVTELDVLRLRLTENAIRKAMTPFEMAADVGRYMELTKASQAEAADFFGISTSLVSKLLSTPKRLAPDLHQYVENFVVCKDVARIVATLPTHELQREVMQRAVENEMKRDAVEGLVRKLRGRSEPKAKAVKVNLGGLMAIISVDDLQKVFSLIGVLEAALKKLERHGLPLSSLPSLLKK